MKKLLFATVVLFAAVFAGCNGNTDNTASSNDRANSDADQQAPGLTIAYIEIDSLLTKYDLAIELRSSLENKISKADRELNAKGSKFEKDFMDYQDKASKGLITRLQAAEMEESLQRQQQQLMQDRENMMANLAEEEQVMNRRVYFAISDYLKEYNADNRYSLILSTATGNGPVLNGDPSMNITNEVLAGINAAYAKEKAAK